ncbi:MAG: sulfatase-like hydrolase/transferase, partial [Bacteroidota bacterium]|nr:sulfatase-like hydrolase/transferase [Bacteroidota bacterium]
MINLFLKSFLFIFSFFIINETYIKNPPNIIFYLSDDKDQIDHNVYGNNLVPSNPINRLAAQGMTFENAYTTQAICAPSRSQIYTGLYPIKNGCYANHLPVKVNTTDVNDYLQSFGYEVVLAGKSHVNPSSVFNWSNYFKNQGK